MTLLQAWAAVRRLLWRADPHTMQIIFQPPLPPPVGGSSVKRPPPPFFQPPPRVAIRPPRPTSPPRSAPMTLNLRPTRRLSADELKGLHGSSLYETMLRHRMVITPDLASAAASTALPGDVRDCLLDWCAENCDGLWAESTNTSSHRSTMFWFEAAADLVHFKLRFDGHWFPGEDAA